MANNTKRTKNNHYEPQIKLKKFGTKRRGKFYLSVYDKSKDKFRHNQDTSKIGSENELYRTMDKNNFNRIENNFTRHETYFQSIFYEEFEILNSLNSEEVFLEDLAKITKYLSISMFRTPSISSSFIDYMNVCVKHINLLNKELFSSSLKLDPVYSRDLYFDDMFTRMVKHVQEYFIDNPSKFFWMKNKNSYDSYCTSDQPVVQFKDGYVLPGKELYSNIDCLLVTVNQNTIFSICHKDKLKLYMSLFSDVNFVNDSFILSSNREIYFHQDNYLYFLSRVTNLKNRNLLQTFSPQTAYSAAHFAKKHYNINLSDVKNGEILYSYELGLTPIWLDKRGGFVFSPEQAKDLYKVFNSVERTADFMLEASKINNSVIKQTLSHMISEYLRKWKEMSNMFSNYLVKK